MRQVFETGQATTVGRMVGIFAALGALTMLGACNPGGAAEERPGKPEWTGETVTVEVTADQHTVMLDENVAYDGFTFNGTIPSEQFTVQEGDSVEFVIHNEDHVAHGLSIHAADAQTSAHVANVAAGETASVTFKAKYPGVFMYHCAPGGHGIMTHTKAGQHGMIVVEPQDAQYGLEADLGREPDLEVFVVQHEVYKDGRDFFDGKPLYVMFNGELWRYVKDPIQARPGDYIRFYYVNNGPNLTSTFHIVGGIFDYMHFQGNPRNVEVGGQSVTSGPTDSWVIEWEVPSQEGDYTMVTHAFGTQTAKGAIGIISVSEDAERTEVVRSEGPDTRDRVSEFADNGEEPRRMVRPFAPGSRDLDRPVRFSQGEEPVIEIVGNSFVPKVTQVPAGTEVTFINEDVFDMLNFEQTGLHNATRTSGPDEFSTPMLEHAETSTITLTEPGTYEYACTMHAYMRGVIEVY